MQSHDDSTSLRRVLLLSAVSGLLMCMIGFLFTGCDESVAAAGGPSSERVERGRYLVSIVGCNDCHTPFKMGASGPEPDMSRMLSGHPEGQVMPAPQALGESPWVWLGAGTNTAFAGPWGVSYAANLTPDEMTGIGSWNEEIFVRTLRTGRHWGQSRPILAPMPWQTYRNMTDDDLKSIFSYLRTIKPIANTVPLAQPSNG
jgi:mono/diheme cytochrome c family protein